MTFIGKRVLVVEDEFLVLLTTVDLSESIGCEDVALHLTSSRPSNWLIQIH